MTVGRSLFQAALLFNPLQDEALLMLLQADTCWGCGAAAEPRCQWDTLAQPDGVGPRAWDGTVWRRTQQRLVLKTGRDLLLVPV